MEKFVQKYSDVPNKFIKDFFNISKEHYNDNDFIINFKNVVKWLNVRKDHLKRLLISKFEKDYDYIIEEKKVINKKGKGANYVEIIKLTPDCFKELCMISQTDKAKQVRKYYLSVEKLMKKYHKYIEEKLLKQIGVLKKNQKSDINIKGGVIYVIKALNSNETLYKLGRSNNIKQRLKNYNSGNANDIEPIFIIEVDDIVKVENCIKNLVRDFRYRKYKEIYEIDINVLKSSIVNCDSLINGFKNILKKNRKIIKKQFTLLNKHKDGLFVYVDKNIQ